MNSSQRLQYKKMELQELITKDTYEPDRSDVSIVVVNVLSIFAICSILIRCWSVRMWSIPHPPLSPHLVMYCVSGFVCMKVDCRSSSSRA